MTGTISSLKRLGHWSLLLLLALCLTGCDSKRTIVHELTESEANNIVVFLASKGIPSTKVKAESGGAGGQAEVLWHVSVDNDRATEAMAILNANGLPRRKGQSLLSIFSQGSALVPSELEEKIRYQAGLAEQIASTIRKIDGVLDADVRLSIPEPDPLNPNASRPSATASVYVKHTGVLDDPNTQLIPKIRRLVASSIQDLSFDNVTVIPDRARFSDVPFSSSSTALGEDKEYVSIWTVIVAKESASRFRWIFFSFILIMFAFFFAIIWTIWKVFPVLESAGGFGQLFTSQPVTLDMLGHAPPKEEEEEEEENEEEEDEGPDIEGAESEGATEDEEEEKR